MRTRTKARQRAVEALFEAEQRGVDVIQVFERNPQVNEYAINIAQTAWSNLGQVDEVINTYSKQWPVDRMPAVDRAILRLAVAEMIFSKDIDTAVVIAEAVEVTKQLSTEESVKFVNGLLGNIGAIRGSLQVW